MKKFAISSLAVVAVLATAGLAAAHDGGMRGGHQSNRAFGPDFDFATVDADKDGKITQAELDAYAKARFDAADTDGSGGLSADEMAAHSEAQRAERAEQMRAMMIQRMDANGDGVVSFEEMQARMDAAPRDRMFLRLDTDKDGALSEAELQAARDRMANRMGDDDDWREGKGGHGEREHMFRDR